MSLFCPVSLEKLHTLNQTCLLSSSPGIINVKGLSASFIELELYKTILSITINWVKKKRSLRNFPIYFCKRGLILARSLCHRSCTNIPRLVTCKSPNWSPRFHSIPLDLFSMTKSEISWLQPSKTQLKPSIWSHERRSELFWGGKGFIYF